MGKPVIDQFSQHLLNSCYNLGKGSAHASCKGPDSMDFRLCRPHILCPNNRQCSMLSQWEAAAVSTEMSGCGCAPITELHLALAVGETRQPCPGVSGFITPETEARKQRALTATLCSTDGPDQDGQRGGYICVWSKYNFREWGSEKLENNQK